MFLIIKTLRSSSAFFACFKTSLTDLQLDFTNVMNVTTSRINAFSCLLPLGKTKSYNSSSVFSWIGTPASSNIFLSLSLISE